MGGLKDVIHEILIFEVLRAMDVELWNGFSADGVLNPRARDGNCIVTANLSALSVCRAPFWCFGGRLIVSGTFGTEGVVHF